MRKIILFLLLGACGLAWGQDGENVVEFCMKPGETTVWRPFESCKELRISTHGSKVVDVTPKADGKLVISALGVGRASVVARCGSDVSLKASVTVCENIAVDTSVRRVRPEGKAFHGKFAFNPPADHFFVTYVDKSRNVVVTRGKIGDEESYDDGTGWDRFWNVKTGENWYFHVEKGWIDDVRFDFEPLNINYSPMNAFAMEADLTAFSDSDATFNDYLGDEVFHGINCWVFFVQKEDGSIVRFWVDPANGCTLKRQSNEDEPCEVSNYNLDYRVWDFGPHYKKRHKDSVR